MVTARDAFALCVRNVFLYPAFQFSIGASPFATDPEGLSLRSNEVNTSTPSDLRKRGKPQVRHGISHA